MIYFFKINYIPISDTFLKQQKEVKEMFIEQAVSFLLKPSTSAPILNVFFTGSER